MEHFPDILYVFSDFGSIGASGERLHNRISSWKSDHRSWDAILGDGLPSDTIAGLPVGAPRFDLHVGRLYEAYIRSWCVCTITVMVRREAAGDALHFAEDVPTYEDVECFARLAGHGLAGFMDCETAWQHKHVGARLTDADAVINADTALKIIGRVWGADEEYLKLHRDEFEAVMDGHRASKVRYLLGRGRKLEARQEFAKFFHDPPRSYYLLTYVPGGLMGFAAGVRRSLYSLGKELRS